MRRLAVVLLAACTATETDSGDSVPTGEIDRLTEDCGPWTGMVQRGSTWTYTESTAAEAEGRAIEGWARVTRVDGPSVRVEWLVTTTSAGTGGDTGDTAAGDSGSEDAEDDTSTRHDVWDYVCDTDGLRLSTYTTQHYDGRDSSGAVTLSGTRSFDPAWLVLPTSPLDTPAWTENITGSSTIPGESSTLAWTATCSVTATTLSTGLGSLSAAELSCSADDADPAHERHAFYAENVGLAGDDEVLLSGYSP